MGVDLNSHTAFEFVAKQETASRDRNTWLWGYRRWVEGGL